MKTIISESNMKCCKFCIYSDSLLNSDVYISAYCKKHKEPINLEDSCNDFIRIIEEQ